MIRTDSKRRSDSTLIHRYFLFLIMGLFYFILLSEADLKNEGMLYIVSNISITIISIILLVRELKCWPYSISMLHSFFLILFFGIAPLFQYLNKRFVYHAYVSNEELVYANILIIIWIIFYFLGNKAVKNSHKYFVLDKLLKKEINISGLSNLFWLFLSGVIAIFLLKDTGISQFFSRASANEIFKRETLAETQLITTFLRNIPLYSLVFSIGYYKKNKKGLIFLILLLIINFVLNSPFGTARFNVGTIYFGLLIFSFSLFKHKRIFVYIFACAMVFIFPVIDIFRYNSLSEITRLSDYSYNLQEYFLTGNYDAFSMIIYSMRYVSDFGLTYGYQLLGPILFWVPRSVWMSKPVGTGSMIAQTYGEPFTNVSASPIVEGFTNFGILGIVSFGFLFGILCSTLDKIYWNRIKSGLKEDTYIMMLYPFLMFLFFFMFRGDLLSSFAYMAGHIAVFSLVFYINYKLFNRA